MAFAVIFPNSRTHLPTSPFKNPRFTSSSTPSLIQAPTFSNGPRHLPLMAAAPFSELGAVEGKVEEEEESSKGSGQDLDESVRLLKRAVETRKVPDEKVLAALSVMKKADVDSSSFLETLGGRESPGRTWMLIFTAQGGLQKGRYFPVTAVQRFDAAAKRIENGVYLGPIGSLTFEGRFSWKKKILSFIFEYMRIKIGPFSPLQISLGKQEGEPTTKDPFFVWFYIDNEIAVAQGKGGGVAFWSQCRRIDE